MEFYSEVVRRLKERLKENKNKPRKIKKIKKYPDTKALENSAKYDFLENLEKKAFPTPVMSKRARSTKGQASSSREETMEEKEFLSNKGLAQSFFNSINTDTFSGPQWVNLFQINKPIFRELVREFFASFEFDASPCRYDPLHKGVTFRLGGVEREMSLLEFGWRVGLYNEGEPRDVATLSGLRGAETVNSTYLTHLFWPSIGDDGFNVGTQKQNLLGTQGSSLLIGASQ
ncbi:hypothetical protein Tco_1203214 [Tanacetum coccineum]